MLDPTLIFIGTVFGLAGLVKGVIGLGLPTISMGLLAVAMPPVHAAVRLRMSPPAFRTWFFAGLLALGIYLVVRSAG